MKVPIDLTQMRSTELLTLARGVIREYNDQNLNQFKVVKQ